MSDPSPFDYELRVTIRRHSVWAWLALSLAGISIVAFIVAPWVYPKLLFPVYDDAGTTIRFYQPTASSLAFLVMLWLMPVAGVVLGLIGFAALDRKIWLNAVAMALNVILILLACAGTV